jgi:hypothetical protein
MVPELVAEVSCDLADVGLGVQMDWNVVAADAHRENLTGFSMRLDKNCCRTIKNLIFKNG